jgi:hypothetical protein
VEIQELRIGDKGPRERRGIVRRGLSLLLQQVIHILFQVTGIASNGFVAELELAPGPWRRMPIQGEEGEGFGLKPGLRVGPVGADDGQLVNGRQGLPRAI